MPSLNFLNRNNLKGDKQETGKNKSPDTNTESDMTKDAKRQLLTQALPPELARELLQDRILTAGATMYIQLAVNTTLDLEEDTDLSKDAKATKRAHQHDAHAKYSDRLKRVLGNETLLPIVSTCLLLDAKTPAADKKEDMAVSILSVEDALACISLLMCNYVLLTATTTNNNTNNKDGPLANNNAGYYDARIRNVLRMASVDILTESIRQEDQTMKDGSLWKTLNSQRPLPIIRKQNSEATDQDEEDVEGKLSELLEAQCVNNKDAKDDETFATTTSTASGDDGDKLEENDHSPLYDDLYRQYASRKFQALEQAIADLIMAQMVGDKAQKQSKVSTEDESLNETADGEEVKGGSQRFSRKSMMRAAKIGGVGVVAGTLFAVTGGMAAPGIAAGLAALGVGGAALTIAASPVALVALFGVGGGGLSAYKMKRRTDGLSEFSISRETTNQDEEANSATSQAHLHTTVCISGWLSDKYDFQRPWGVTPSDLEYLERLQRFFAVVDPSSLDDAKGMVKPMSDESKAEELWAGLCNALENQYDGKSPDNLLPLENSICKLSANEISIMQKVFIAITRPEDLDSNKTEMKEESKDDETKPTVLTRRPSEDHPSNTFYVWDHQSEYGGDLYTIQWESQMLLKMCRVADNMVKELANKATKEVLKKTALATVMAAVAMPSLLLGLAGSLDSDWSLITIRSDIAGKELARSLLQSDEKRPVNLVGFSFGARMIYSCLLELARHQELWEQQEKENQKKGMKLWNKRSKDDDTLEYTREPASIVQDVVLMGTPVFVSRSKLRQARRMVAGRCVNCYSRKDWILSLMFQYKNTSGIMRGTLGTGPIQGVASIDNYDVTSLVASWHSNYCHIVPDILHKVGFDQPLPMNNN